MDKVSYALGLGIGRQLSDMGAESLNIDDFAQAIKDVIAGKQPQIGENEAQRIVQEFFANQEKQQRAGGRRSRGWWYYSAKSSKDRINQGFLADLVLQENALGKVFTGGTAPFSTENMTALH